MSSAARATVLIFVSLSLWAQAAPTSLEPQKTIEREIKADEVHQYHVSAESGQYLYLVVKVFDVDLALSLSAPDGKPLVSHQADAKEAGEDLPWIVSASGVHALTVRSRAGAPAGRYELLLRDLRRPAPADRTRTAAFQAFVAARDLSSQARAASTKRAIEKFQESLAGWQSVEDQRWQGRIFHQIASCWEALGELNKSRDALLEALPLRRAAGNRYGEALTLNSLGVFYTNAGDPAKALEYLGPSLELRRALADRRGEAVTLNNIALAYDRHGEPSRALEMLKQSLAIRREVKDRRGEAVTLNNMAGQYRTLGELQQALDHNLQALALRREVGDRRGEGNSLTNIGALYISLGEPNKAVENWRQAAAVFETVGDRRGLATTFVNLGAQSDDTREALSYLDRALSIRKEIGDRRGEAVVVIDIARTQLKMGEASRARVTAEAGLELARRIGDRQSIARALYYAGKASTLLREYARAETLLRESASVFEAVHATHYEIGSLSLLAEVERSQGKLEPALEHSRLAFTLSESIRGSVADAELRAAYRDHYRTFFGSYVEVLMRMHQRDPSKGLNGIALEAIERSRARSLVETLAESQIDLRLELSAEQRSREQQLLGRINASQRELFRGAAAAARRSELEKQLTAAERDLSVFQLELRKAGSQYAAVRYASVLAPEQIRADLLREDTALVEYNLGLSQSYVWVLTSSGMTSAVLPPRQKIEERIAAYRKELAQRASALTVHAALARLDAAAAQLYADLIAPIEKALAPARRLVIVPDGLLSYLPFETLGGETLLIERFAVSYAPSASALASLRSRSADSIKPPRMLLAYGDPAYAAIGGRRPAALDYYAERGLELVRLPNTRTEVTAIRSLFPAAASKVYLGSEAREENVKSEPLDQYRFIHFAAHGHYDEEQPSRSGIVLSTAGDSSQDGVLQVPEILRLRLHADMVSLSACQTGLGKLLAGEGVTGMAQAFLYAGADSLLISLWNVNDASTSELMKLVYQNLNHGLSRDEALRQAKLKLMHSPRSAWRHPYYWAPFVLMGNADPAPATISKVAPYGRGSE